MRASLSFPRIASGFPPVLAGDVPCVATARAEGAARVKMPLEARRPFIVLAPVHGDRDRPAEVPAV